MPKAPSLTPDKLIKKLIQNGFVLYHQTGSHRIYYNKDTGKRVVVPFHRKDLPKGTLLSILKAAGLEDRIN